MKKAKDLYQILKVLRTASQEEIKRSYRKLAMKYHPDRNPGDAKAEERYKQVGEAYDVLSDPQRRDVYDQTGDVGKAAAVDRTLEEVLPVIAKALNQIVEEMREQGHRPKNFDLIHILTINLEKERDQRRKGLKIAKRNLEELKGRFISKTEHNLFEDLIRRGLENIESRLKSIEGLEKALDYLKNYSFRKDGDEAVWGPSVWFNVLTGG